MTNPSAAIESGLRVLRQEAAAILACQETLGTSFGAAVELIFNCEGRVVTCGIGKSGHIARKTAGTLSSTGTPSLFLHAAEAVHGDLGMVTAKDVLVLYSHSGETDELVRLFPSLRAIGAASILITGRPDSSGGRLADIVLNTGVVEEACSNNLAPTSSTTVMLALSDALAIAVMDLRGFGREDFARFHPSGTLGKRLLLQVADVMRPSTEIAVVKQEDHALEVIKAMTDAAVGVACVCADDKLIGLISESDLRRHFLREHSLSQGSAQDMMNRSFLTIGTDLLAIEALEVFQNHPVKIGEIPVVHEGGLLGLLVLKDLLRSGIV